jgi:hypothetical protein
MNLSLAVCRYYARDSWFEGRLTRGLREIFTLLSLGGCTLDVGAAATPPWNALQMVFHRFHSGIVAYDSWFRGNRLVVQGKQTRGLREIHTWFEGNYSWFGGSRARGLGEITRGLREAFRVKVLQTEGTGS